VVDAIRHVIHLLREVLATRPGPDRDARRLLFNPHRARRRVHCAWADSVYVGKLGRDLPAPDPVEIVRRPEGIHTFEVLPRRWVVERTLAWITGYRPCIRDYERLRAHHEVTVYWAMITLMTRRLTGSG
jgi:transposase